MPIYIDQMNREVEIPAKPRRIISIVPSQTELLFDLGLDAEIAGVTKFCIHPAEKVNQKVKIGGTKALNISQVKEINPDLIIGNKEENEREQIEELMQYFPVWMSDISNLDEAISMIKQVGEITGKASGAITIADRVIQQFNKLPFKQSGHRVAYFIWRKPYIVAGKGTFIDDMLTRCGFISAFETTRYPEVNNEQIIAAKPDVVLLSSEPYPFKHKHVREFESLLPHAKVRLVDGELFSWYGSRLLKAPEYFHKLNKLIEWD
jgi:ABC-type Fe3+-hydroxamate transport system substrate-binding protein